MRADVGDVRPIPDSVHQRIAPDFEEDCVTRICKVPTHAVLSVDDPLAGQESVSLTELATRPLVLLDLPQTSTYLMTLFDILATRPVVSLRTRSYETIRAAVSAGFGVSILNMRPSSGHSAADNARLVRKPITDVLHAPTLITVDIYGTNKPAFVRAIIDIIRTLFRELGPHRFAVTTPDLADTLFDV